jgi:hypothetical protein
MKALKLCAAFAVILLSCASCRRTEPAPAPTAAFPFAERLGWLHGTCLAISNPKLAGGTPVTLVIMGDPQKVESARIDAKPASPETCQALLPARAQSNAKQGMTFYTLEAKDLHPTEMGIGIVESPAEPKIVNGLARVDLALKGQSAVFSSCATTEGIKFGVWPGKAYQGEPLWSAYYYLGYDQHPNCP